MRDAGRIGFVYRGDYSDADTYEKLDVVYYNGASYVAKKETRGNIPARNNEFWHIQAGIDMSEYVKKEELQEIGDSEIEKIWNEVFGEGDGA